MRVGLVGAGYETVALLSVLPLDGLEIDIFLDRAMRPRAMKDHALIEERVVRGSAYLQTKGVDALLVPPVYEQSVKDALPLFMRYVREVVAPHSLVGKLGLLANRSDLHQAEEIMKNVLKDISLTDRQQRTKVFHTDFPLRTKDISHRQLQLPFAGRRDRMIRNLVKTDLRYFKDAAVDTLVPLDRSVLSREKQINHAMGAKKKFHGKEMVKLLLAELLPAMSGKKSDLSTLHIHATALPGKLLASKPRKRLLEQGKTRELKIELIEHF